MNSRKQILRQTERARYTIEKEKIRLEIGAEIVQLYGMGATETAEALLLEIPICPDFDKILFMTELESRIGKTAAEAE